MIETILTLGIAIVIAVALWYFLKNVTKLIINSVVGIVLLLIFNFFNIFGMGDIPISLASVLICALGGIPGFVVLLLLNVVGITV
ncbi:pro-sigmaK processing inhibitor BofA family protein [Methanogenium organophilum]|uniref:Pro-sigmaK processing inhibitor BofA family protein n=1 Tax=Methanogenium organophilum TaxID=2199 RepID=A0A9X9S7H5_METOG|nr:pro-sigmaK processing inhibitor BofA family protein [Methanogenium organophilum]WAI02255.1 pro-sigmaK processing inhibitor BofA family protein [Methanogenium organophilum]